MSAARDALDRAAAIEPRLRGFLLREWEEAGFLPCCGAIDFGGDPTLTAGDAIRFLGAPVSTALKLATLLCWPARAARILDRGMRDAERTVRTRGPLAFRFHTPFADFFFFEAARRVLAEPAIDPSERRAWHRVLEWMIDLAAKNETPRVVNGESLPSWTFLPREGLHLSGSGSWLVRASGMMDLDSDADDTFVVLEMFARYLEIPEEPGGDAARGARAAAARMLDRPAWKLARRFQFPAGERAAVNYTGVAAAGGVSTYFGVRPTDAPDLTVNANVLCSMLANRRRWRLLDDDDAVSCAGGMIAFIEANVMSGLWRTERGHSFYTPRFFAAMFGRLWREFVTLDEAERRRIDPGARLARARSEVSDALVSRCAGVGPGANPIDAALVTIALCGLEAHAPAAATALTGLCARFDGGRYPYPAYEVFKGKIPVLVIYGSEALTVALALIAIQDARASALL